MGLWSKIKNAVKKAVTVVANIVKGIVRDLLRVVLEIIHRVINIVGALVAYNKEKKLRVHIVILHEPGQMPLITEQEAQASFMRASAILKDRFNVRVYGFGKPYLTTLKEESPHSALNVECGFFGYFKQEYGEAGNFFASHLAGWNVTPVTFMYPVTVFVVAHVTHDGKEWRGCSWWIASDYIVLTPTAMNDDTTLAHEIGHSCGLRHDGYKIDNLMNHSFTRGTSVTGWQKFVFRTSRHVNFY
jgi:hypothetical protein